MKKILFSFMFVTIFVNMTAHAYTGVGVCNLGKENLSDFTCYGPAGMDGTMVSGEVKVIGPLKASNVTMGAMTVTGMAYVENSTVTGPVNVTGYFVANHSVFQQNLTLIGTKMMLNGSTVTGSVSVKGDQNTPYLRLVCGTKISGAVVFDGLPGVVQMTADSSVTGKITNAKLETVVENCKK